jgi:hypothetical protein
VSSLPDNPGYGDWGGLIIALPRQPTDNRSTIAGRASRDRNHGNDDRIRIETLILTGDLDELAVIVAAFRGPP